MLPLAKLRENRCYVRPHRNGANLSDLGVVSTPVA
jgi:hypothetical protein